MRITGVILCAAASMLATAALAQSTGGSMSMSGNSMSGGNAMVMKPNSQGGVGIFSRQDMAMMIVDRDKATKGMSDEEKVKARQEEMAHDQAETADQRMARKQRYDAEWAQLTPAERTDALVKLDAQMKARAQAMSAHPAQ